MKIVVVTESGRVVGTAQFPQKPRRGSPFGGRITPLPGQVVHELELPASLCKIETPEEIARFHAEIENRIRNKAGGASRRR